MTENTTSQTQAVVVEGFRSPLRDMTDMLSDLVNVATIARRLNKSQPNVHQMLNGKGAPAPITGPDLGERGRLFSWAEVEDFMDRKKAKRLESAQKKLDAAQRAQERAEKAIEEAEKAKAVVAALQAEAEETTEDAPILDIEEEDADTLDLGEDFDLDIEEDAAAEAAAAADFEAEDAA